MGRPDWDPQHHFFARLERQQIDVENLVSENNMLRRAIAMPYSIHEKWVDPSVAYLFNRTLHEVTQLKRELGVYKKLMRETLSVMLTKNGESLDDAKNYTIRNHAITEVMTRIRSVCYE